MVEKIKLFFSSLSFVNLALFSAFFASLGHVLAKTILKEVKSKDIVGINFLIMAGSMLIFVPFFYYFKVSFASVSCVIFIAYFDTISNFYFFKAIEKTEITVITPILSLAPVFVFFFSWLFLGEQISFATFLLCCLLIFSIIFSSFDISNFKKFKANTLLPAIITSTISAFTAIPSKFILYNLEAINPPTLYMLRAALIGLIAALHFKSSFHSITTKQYRWIFVRGITVILQWIFLYYALLKGSVGVTITISNTTPIFVFFIGIFFLKERMTFKKIFAAILAFILSFFISKETNEQ